MRWTRKSSILVVVVGWLNWNLAPGAKPRSSYPGGSFQGKAGWLGAGLLTALGGSGVGFNV